MAHVSMTVWAKRLETVSGPDFQILLDQIKSPVYIDESILKSELALLATKVMKLLRSSNTREDYYQIWKACHTAVIICSFNPLVLVAHGGQLLTGIYNKLEQFTDYIDTSVWTLEFDTLLSTLVSSLKNLMDLMRNNPTLSRESLVPKLKAIIPTLIKLTPSKPVLTLPVLANLLFNHSTTFKPFVNKYRVVLQDLLTNEDKYEQFDSHLKKLVCKNYTYLHLIKNGNGNNNNNNNNNHSVSFADENWRTGLLNVIRQYQPIFSLFNDILDMDQDESLKSLIKTLPLIQTNENDKSEENLLFGDSLRLDLNEPFTLFQISNRITLLNDLLIEFITLPTHNAVRIPLKLINNLAEIQLNLNTKYLAIKRELRHDHELSDVIEQVLVNLQSQGIKLWLVMLQNFQKQCLIFIPNIINSMSLFIPVNKAKKNNSIDFPRCQQLQVVFTEIFKLINYCMPHLGHQLNTELDSLTKLIDVALYLVEDKSLLEPFFNLQKKQKLEMTKAKANNNNKSNNKKLKKDNNGSLSDLYTHSTNFNVIVSLKQLDQINEFFFNIINNWKLSSILQIKISKYVIGKSLQYQQSNELIPETFIKLLRAIVINPGFERVSILPIAVSLLNGHHSSQSDDVFDVLCHPRLPLGIVHNLVAKRVGNNDIIDEAIEEENEAPIDEVAMNEDAQAQEEDVVDKDEVKIGLKEQDNVSDEIKTSTHVVDETMVLKRSRNETEENKTEHSKRVKINDTVEEVKFSEDEPSNSISHEPSASEKEQEDEDDDDDDEEFVIPDIELSDDDDE